MTGTDSSKIQLGSLWVSYIESYHQASQKLFPATRTLAYPILYLQRHTFELLLKEVLSLLLEMREECDMLDTLFGTLSGTGPVAPDEFDVANATHSFGRIFPALERNLEALQLPPIPQAFRDAHKLFHQVDEDKPDRLRFATIYNKDRKSKRPSFPRAFDDTKAKYAPCAEARDLLEQIVVARERQLDISLHGRSSTSESELDKFYEAFWDASRASEHQVACALGSLVAHTKAGHVVWRWVSAPAVNVNEHPELKPIAGSLREEYLETSFDNRILVILILRDVMTVRSGSVTHTEDGAYLAARRSNGTVTLGIWPDYSQTNLLYEIQEAFKRARSASSDHAAPDMEEPPPETEETQ